MPTNFGGALIRTWKFHFTERTTSILVTGYANRIAFWRALTVKRSCGCNWITTTGWMRAQVELWLPGALFCCRFPKSLCLRIFLHRRGSQQFILMQLTSQ